MSREFATRRRKPVRVNASVRGWHREDEPIIRDQVLGAVREGLEDPAGLSDADVARRAGCSERFVLRYRQRQVPPIPNCFARRRAASPELNEFRDRKNANRAARKERYLKEIAS